MATLASGEIDDLWADLMSEFSGSWTVVPFNKAKFRAGLEMIDAALETAEVSIFQAVSDADVRSWMQANQPIARLIIERVERRRKEAL